MKIIHITLIAAFLLSAITAQASQYQLNRLGFPAGNDVGSALRINNAGEVLGNSRLIAVGANDSSGAFLWNKTSGMVDIQIEGKFDCPGDINNNGQVTGYGQSTAVLREADGKLVQLNPISESAYGTEAYGLNDNGWVVGRSGRLAVLWQGGVNAQAIGGNSDSDSYAVDVNNNGSIIWCQVSYQYLLSVNSYIWNQGNNVLLKALNFGDYCQAEAINNLGTIVGSSGNHAVVWGSDGNIILDLGVGSANGINNMGQIVGVKDDRAVLWNPDGSICANLGLLAGANVSSVACGINDFGQVVGGIVYDEYNNMEPTLWQPVPEPSSILALFCGLGSLSAFKILKRK